ncbi:hypothetical protein MP228_004013 [Amoeboaphelidium protococcarum]|nr:hypothetical protein MP228_004013 [Amoeboaphelidium protococcarum]
MCEGAQQQNEVHAVQFIGHQNARPDQDAYSEAHQILLLSLIRTTVEQERMEPGMNQEFADNQARLRIGFKFPYTKVDFSAVTEIAIDPGQKNYIAYFRPSKHQQSCFADDMYFGDAHRGVISKEDYLARVENAAHGQQFQVFARVA